jgi:hypothetical protein
MSRHLWSCTTVDPSCGDHPGANDGLAEGRGGGQHAVVMGFEGNHGRFLNVMQGSEERSELIANMPPGIDPRASGDMPVPCAPSACWPVVRHSLQTMCCDY